MLNKEKVSSNIAELKMYQGKCKPKYLRNLRLYLYSMNVFLDQIKEGNLVGYWSLMDHSDYTSSINENVIQSAIDALVSQLASKNARPFFTTINGTYKQMQVAKQAQQYFDQLYDKQNVTKVVTEAFRDACIFETGYVFVDPDKKKIEKALPWQVMIRPAESTYQSLTRVYYERKQYPTSLIPGYKGDKEYVTYGLYFDTVNKTRAVIIEEDNIFEVYDWDKDALPFIPLHYVEPIFGKSTTSVVDVLYGIQMKLDELYQTISEASRKNPAQTFFVPQGSNIKVTQLTNRIGQIITYKPIPEVTNPIHISTPEFLSNQYIQMAQTLKDDAYELVGISKLSAQSKKPSDLSSGKALKTLNDIESERFEVQYKTVIRTYVEIAERFILLVDKNDLVLPEDINRHSITWEDVQNNYNKMKMQFSSMDFLSKDPSTRVQEIDLLVSKGIIPASRAALYYDMPDSEASYNYANNAINAVMSVIDKAIEEEDYTIAPFIPLDLLKNEIVNTMLSLQSVENKQNLLDIEKLKLLYQEAENLSSKLAENAQNQAVQADQQAFDQTLGREVETTYQTTLAQASAQVAAQQVDQY